MVDCSTVSQLKATHSFWQCQPHSPAQAWSHLGSTSFQALGNLAICRTRGILTGKRPGTFASTKGGFSPNYRPVWPLWKITYLFTINFLKNAHGSVCLIRRKKGCGSGWMVKFAVFSPWILYNFASFLESCNFLDCFFLRSSQEYFSNMMKENLTEPEKGIISPYVGCCQNLRQRVLSSRIGLVVMI